MPPASIIACSTAARARRCKVRESRPTASAMPPRSRICLPRSATCTSSSAKSPRSRSTARLCRVCGCRMEPSFRHPPSCSRPEHSSAPPCSAVKIDRSVDGSGRRRRRSWQRNCGPRDCRWRGSRQEHHLGSTAERSIGRRWASNRVTTNRGRCRHCRPDAYYHNCAVPSPERRAQRTISSAVGWIAHRSLVGRSRGRDRATVRRSRTRSIASATAMGIRSFSNPKDWTTRRSIPTAYRRHCRSTFKRR